MKTGKEIKINNLNDYKIVFGSVNNKHPKTIYINISAWAEPKIDEEELNYSKIIKDLHKNIKQFIYKTFDNNTEYTDKFVKEKTIVDLDIRESGIKFGKKSFINCEITLFLKTEISITSESSKLLLNKLTNSIITNNFNNNEYFSFHKRKI